MKIFIYLSMLFLFIGCNSINNQIKPKSTTPFSKKAVYIESESFSEISVLSYGRGNSFNEAVYDSKLTALWFVLNGNKNPLLNNKQSKENFIKFSHKYYTNIDDFIIFESNIKSKKQNKMYVISKIYKINIQNLKENLIQDNIIDDIQNISNNIDMPSISIIVNKNSNSTELENNVAINTISEYFQNNNFEVKSIQGIKNSNKNLMKYMNLNNNIDPLYFISLKNGSDILVIININNNNRTKHNNLLRKSIVSAKAYYTSSSKQLASSIANSEERIVSNNSVLIQEATNDLSLNIISQIKNSWSKEIKNGKLFKIIVSMSEYGNISDNFDKAIRNSCERVKKSFETKTKLDYDANCKVENSSSLFKLLQKNYEGDETIKKDLESGTLLLLNIE